MRYAHLSRLPDDFDRVHSYLPLIRRDSVADRFHMSEPAYAAGRGDLACPLSPEEYRIIDGHLRVAGALVVVITADDALLRSRHAERAEQEMYDADLVCHVNGLFRGIASRGWFRYPDGKSVYHCDVDLHFHCSPTMPFVGDVGVDMIIERYLTRSETWSSVDERGKRSSPSSTPS